MTPDPTDLESRLDDGHDALDAGDLAGAERAAAEVLRGVRGRRDEDSVALANEAELLLGWVYVEDRRDEDALRHLQHIFARTPNEPDALYLAGWLRLLRWEFDDAERLFGRCGKDENLAAIVTHQRAVLAELRGRHDEAERLYREAAQLDAEACPLPVRMSDDEAHALLGELVAAFPADVRAALANVRIDLVDVPQAAIDAGPDTDPLVLGLYHGVPIGEKSESNEVIADSVRIFKRNIERLAHDRDQLREQLRITLLHEVGHHLGWDEDDLAARGLA